MKVFWCRLLKLFGKIFTKNLYNFRILLSLIFQMVSYFKNMSVIRGAGWF
ncbi:hypothetical protein GXY_14280 [Novacetimonas hansenii ATCC 23769]|uniref:Uncharacterized protein n=1 Tax=Novacetimonas hansenii ATCC 23769 TaxID=714995 RepID=D5QI75_NOVHA|nr:hypothetical protein GXY_14280 [Novacetimonas hansenii ATCC 23769]